MAHYYQDPNHDVYAYECGYDGNYGNNEYESYSDYAEPDQCEYEDSDTQYHEDTPEGFEHGYEEPEYEGDGDGTDWEGGYEEGIKVNELEHKGDEETIHELEQLEYRANEEEYGPEGFAYEGNEIREHENTHTSPNATRRPAMHRTDTATMSTKDPFPTT
jgi:hypothetical protein